MSRAIAQIAAPGVRAARSLAIYMSSKRAALGTGIS
jgi:hypothetical protein